MVVADQAAQGASHDRQNGKATLIIERDLPISLIIPRARHDQICVIDAGQREHPEYRALAAGDRSRAALLDFAVLFRRRVADLSSENAPWTENDLEHIAAAGRDRGEKGISPSGHRHILVLHAMLTLRDIQEAAGPNDIDHLAGLLGWITTHSPAARTAYTNGYLAGQRDALPAVKRNGARRSSTSC